MFLHIVLFCYIVSRGPSTLVTNQATIRLNKLYKMAKTEKQARKDSEQLQQGLQKLVC